VTKEILLPLDFGKEIRLIDEATGGEKGSKQAMFSLIPTFAQTEEAKVYGMGAVKYAPYNWRKGYPFSWSYDALQRHLNAFWNGEDYDPESGLLHLAHARWHTGVLMEFIRYDLGTDDRVGKVESNANPG